MKLIVAILKPFRAETAIQALQEAGFADVLVSEVKGFGRQKEHLSDYRESEYAQTYLPKIKLELMAPDEKVAEVEQILLLASRTGRMGDGKLMIMDLEGTGGGGEGGSGFRVQGSGMRDEG